MDQSLVSVLRQAEALLKDKTVHYLVAVADGVDVKYLYDSKVAAKGIVDMIRGDIAEDWKDSRPRVEE